MSHRLLCSLLVALALLPAPTAEGSSAVLAQFAQQAGTNILEGMIEAAGGKLVDAIWAPTAAQDDKRVAELDQRLATYEGLLRQVDQTLARDVAQLRASLSTKTTPADVQKILQPTLAALKDRLKSLEGKVDTIDARVRDLEEAFAGLKLYVAPCPLLLSSVHTASPKAHHLTVSWLKLLVRSEENRVELLALLQRYAATSMKVQKAKLAEKQILADTIDLYDKIKQEIAAKLAQREEMMKEFQSTAPEVREIDDDVSSLMWLIAVARPLSDGDAKGRLGFPLGFFGREASDLVTALELSGVDGNVVNRLYARQLRLMTTTSGPYKIKTSEVFDTTMKSISQQSDAAMRRLAQCQGLARSLQIQMEVALEDYSPQHPSVVVFAKQREALQENLSEIHQQLEHLYQQAVRAFVEALKVERGSSIRMTQFRVHVLEPLAAGLNLADSEPWNAAGRNGAFWDFFTGADLKWPAYGEFDWPGNDPSVQFSQSSTELLAFRGSDKVYYSYDVAAKTSHKVAIDISGISCVSGISHTGMIAVGSYESDVYLHSFVDESKPKLCGNLGGRFTLRSLSISNNGHWLATENNGFVKIWDIKAIKQTGTLKSDKRLNPPFIFTPDCRVLICHDETNVVFFDVQSFEQTDKLIIGYGICSLALSPNGRVLAICRPDESVQLWDVEKRSKISTLPLLPNPKSRDQIVQFSPDGRILAIGGDSLELWDTRKQRAMGTRKFKSRIKQLFFSLDGRTLAVRYKVGYPEKNMGELIDLSSFQSTVD